MIPNSTWSELLYKVRDAYWLVDDIYYRDSPEMAFICNSLQCIAEYIDDVLILDSSNGD